MAYGRINRLLVRAGGAGTQVAVAHAIADAIHCSFLIQDATGGTAIRALGAAFVATADKGANQDLITDNTAAGAPAWDVLTVAAYSRYDVGPIVNGITRGATAISPWTGTNYPGHVPMRSLHYNVPVTIPNGANTSGDVVITHRLGSANTVFFSSPTSNPLVSTAGGNRPMILTRTASAADTLTVRGMTVDAAVSNAGVDTTVTFDVMVLTRTAGMHTNITRPHGQGTIPLGTYVAGMDYGAVGGVGDRQLTAAQANRAGGPASYGALYINVDGIVAGGADVIHNMGLNTGGMALVSHTGAVAGGRGMVAIANNAGAGAPPAADGVAMRLVETEAVQVDNAYVLFVRPYSPYIL